MLHRLFESPGLPELLAEAAAVLVEKLDYEESLARVGSLAVPRFADFYSVDLVGKHGNLHSISTIHADDTHASDLSHLREQYGLRPDDPVGPSRVIRTGQAEIYARVDTNLLQKLARDETHLKLLKKLGLRSVMIIPLSARGKVFGALTFISTKKNFEYSEQDFTVALDLSRQIEAAVDHYELYRDSAETLLFRDEFLSIASHELRTPLTSLKMQLQIAQRSLQQEFTSAGSKVARALQISAQQVVRLENLIAELLNLSQIQSGRMVFEFQVVNLAQIVQETVGHFHDELNAAHCDVEFVMSDQVWVECDPFRIEQVLVNLISNAIKYASGRPIRIEIIDGECEAGFSIEDHGIGIPRDKQQKVFLMYERAASSQNVSGLGLGLYLAKEIVDEHKGRILLESHPGKGSKFSVILPKKKHQLTTIARSA